MAANLEILHLIGHASDVVDDHLFCYLFGHQPSKRAEHDLEVIAELLSVCYIYLQLSFFCDLFGLIVVRCGYDLGSRVSDYVKASGLFLITLGSWRTMDVQVNKIGTSVLQESFHLREHSSMMSEFRRREGIHEIWT